MPGFDDEDTRTISLYPNARPDPDVVPFRRKGDDEPRAPFIAQPYVWTDPTSIPLRDWLYDRFAAVRYRIFGKYDSCPLPSPEVRARFVDG